MLTESVRKSRGQAMAEAFFFRLDQELLRSYQEKLNREEKIRAFETLIGIRDSNVIRCLIDAGFDLSTATAFIWAPALFVAWADGELDDMEKGVIIETLPNKGVSREAACMIMEHDWFNSPPSNDLWDLWTEFTLEMLKGFKKEDREAVKNEIISLCRDVAQASGGFFGLGRVSTAELETIERIDKVLSDLSNI